MPRVIIVRGATLSLSLTNSASTLLPTPKLDAFVDRQYDKVVQREAVLAPPELLDDDEDNQNRS
jgi:hypothetical protein